MNPKFQSKVDQQIQQLKQQSFRSIESGIAHKRLDWLRQSYPAPVSPDLCTPRKAFELLFFEYMGLSPDELPVVSEMDTEIVWQSRNPCPTLEATRTLGLDTRKICRAINEKSTQAFLSHLDPELRFLRSYQEIRPHSDYCLERIFRADFEGTMRIALDEARQSLAEGNKGYGAVVTLGDLVVGRAHDTAVTEQDPSLHAEVNAIRQAVRVLGESNLSGAILYSTCEPCPMCSALAVWANLTTIVYGVSIEETARLGRSRILVGAKEMIARSPVTIEVIGGVLKGECRSLYV